jgi:hypothetical protein
MHFQKNALSYGIIAVFTAIFSVSFLLKAESVSAAMYQPGATLNPSCSPTDADCGVTAPVTAQSNASDVELGPTGITSGDTADLKFFELSSNGTNYTGFKAPDALGSNIIYTLPSSEGSSGQVLTTDGSGSLSWSSALTNTLASGMIFVGNSSNHSAAVALSGDASINSAGVLTIAPNAVGLGTDTTGNYVASISTGSGLSGGDGGSEGAALTLALDIDGLAAISSIANDDYIPIYDVSSGTNTKVSRNDFLAPVLGALNYQGTWDASASSEPETCDTSNRGHYFVVSAAGNGYAQNDWSVCNGTSWDKLMSTSAIASVFGRTGTITAQSGDYTALKITNTVAGNISSTTVQGALDELDSEKQAANSSLTSISNLAVSSGNFIVGDGSSFSVANGSAARTLLGLGASDTPTFSAILLNGDTVFDLTGTGLEVSGGTLGLADGGITFSKLASNSCSSGQIMKFNGSSWVCAADNNNGGTNGNLTSSTSGVTITGGTGAVLGTGATVDIASAGASQSGLLSSADWNTFNDKQDSLTFSGPLFNNSNTISISQANGSASGYLSSADWTTFNDKQNALTLGNVSSSTAGVTVTGGSNAVIGLGVGITISDASGTQNGLLTSADWNTFNAKQNAISTDGKGLAFSANVLSLTLADSTLSKSSSGLKVNLIGSGQITDGSIQAIDIATDAVTLGTKTNGNYVASLANGIGITGANGGSEGSALTLSLDIDSLTATTSSTDADTIPIYTGTGIKKIAKSNLLAAVTGALTYQGSFDGNSSSLSTCDAGSKGYYYVANVNGADYDASDWAVCSGLSWQKISNTTGVASFNGRQGTLTPQNGDYSASQITNTATGNISSTTVQSAINELDSEKIASALTSGLIFVGNDSNVATAVTMSGDVAMDNTGVTSIGEGKVTDSMLSGNIAWSKILKTGAKISDLDVPGYTGNAGKILSTDGTNLMWASGLTSTLTAGSIFVGNSSSAATAVAVSGDGTISDTGALTISHDAVALGTDTTGNYVSGATTNGGLTLTGTEGGTLGINLEDTSLALSSSGLKLNTANANSWTGVQTFTQALVAPTTTNTINGLVINSGALSGVKGIAMSSGNFAQTGTGTFSTGTGAVSLNGNTTISGSQTLSTQSITDVSSGGSIGLASLTVDVSSSFAINQTTAGQYLTIPSPTNTTAGKVVYVSNVGSASFYLSGATVATGKGLALVWNGSAWSPMNAVTSSNSVPFSSLSNASSVSILDNGKYAQGWNWSTATTEDTLAISAESLTTGTGLSISSSSANLNSLRGLLYVANQGTSTSGILARFISNANVIESGLTVLTNGNVGIGETSPTVALDVTGAARATTSVSSPIFQGNAGSVTFGNASYASTIAGSALTISPTAWTATPTISGLITATSGLTSTGTLTANGALTANGTFTLGDNGDTGSINTSDWDISTTGALTGISGITTDGSYTQSGTSTNTLTGDTTLTSASTTTNPLTITANSLTTGTGLSLTSSNTSLASTNGLLYVANTGASTSGILARFASNSTAGTGLTILTSGNVGVGTASPTVALDVTGAARATTSVSSPIFQGNAGSVTFGNASYASTIAGSALTISPTAWTATPTISGLITATGGLTSTGTLTANGALTANGTFTLGDNGDTGSINTSDWDISTTGALTGISGITTDGSYTQSGTSVNTFTGSVGIGTASPFSSLSNSSSSVTAFNSGTAGSNAFIWRGASTGTTDAGANYMAAIENTNSNSYGSVLLLRMASTNVAAKALQITGSGGSELFSFTGNGDAFKSGGGSWNSTSDERLKKDISKLDGGIALDTLMKLNPVTYTWRNADLHDSWMHAGFTAQQIQEVFPHFVSSTSVTGADKALVEGETALGYSLPFDFDAYLVKSIQTQQGMIVANSDKITTLDMRTKNIVSVEDGKTVFKGTVIADTIQANRIAGLEFVTTQMSDTDAKLVQYGKNLGFISEDLDDLDSKVSALSSSFKTKNLVVLDTAKVKKLEVSGAVTFKGDAEFQGPVVFQKVAEFLDKSVFRNDVEFAGNVSMDKKVVFASDAAGYATIKKGESDVEVKFSEPYAETPVITVTLRSSTKLDYYRVTDESEKGFTIEIDPKQDKDVKFAWTAIAVSGNKADENDESDAASESDSDSIDGSLVNESTTASGVSTEIVQTVDTVETASGLEPSVSEDTAVVGDTSSGIN